MDFRLDDDQMALADAVERYCEREHPRHTRGDAPQSEQAQRRWQVLAETGFVGLPIAAEHGGSALGMAEMMLVAESFGRALAGAGWLSSVALAGMTIQELGNRAQRERWLGPLVAGKGRYGFAFGEPGAGNEHRVACTLARPHPAGGWQIDGRKHLVLDGADVAMFVLVARLDPEHEQAFSLAGGAAEHPRADAQEQTDGPSALAVFAIDADTPGLQVRPFETLDGRRAAHLELRDVRVGDDHLLGQPGHVEDAVADAMDRGAALLVAEAVGVLDALIAQTAEHLRTRHQFGRPLAEFQVLQHLIADQVIALEQARSMAYVAAVALDDEQLSRAQRQRYVSAAKALVGPAARRAAMQAIQMHGAMGMTDECRIGHYAKRLMVIDRLFGDESHHLRRLARVASNR